MAPATRVILISATGSIVTMAVGVTALALGHGKLGWLLILLSLIGGTVGAGFIFLGRQSMARAAALSSGTPPAVPYIHAIGGILHKGSASDVTSARWTGGARVPSPLGYVGLSSGLAVLEIRQGKLLFRVRQPIVRMMFGIENLEVTTYESAQLISFRRKRGKTGIEIRVPQRPSYYFWPKRPDEVMDEIMTAATALGVEVAARETP